MKIVKGKIGNAITSVAADHVVAVTSDIYDENLEKYQSEINDLKADKTDVEEAIKAAVSTAYKVKGSVNSYLNLPTGNNSVGDVYNILDTGANYVWDGTDWDALSGITDISSLELSLSNEISRSTLADELLTNTTKDLGDQITNLDVAKLNISDTYTDEEVDALVGHVSTIFIDQSMLLGSEYVSGDVQGDALKWIRANTHRYVSCLYSDPLVIAQLDDENSNYLANGEDLTSYWTDERIVGRFEMWIKLPEFWWKCEEVSLNKYAISWSTIETDGWHKWDTNELLNVFAASSTTKDETNKFLGEKYYYTSSGSMYTKPGTDLFYSTGILYSALKRMARNHNGSKYSTMTWEWHCMLRMLFYGWYGTTSLHHDVDGLAYASMQTGMTISTGMTDNPYLGSLWGIELINNSIIDNIYGYYDGTINVVEIWDLKTGTSRKIPLGKRTATNTDNQYFRSIYELYLGSYCDFVPKVYDTDYYSAVSPNGYGIVSNMAISPNSSVLSYNGVADYHQGCALAADDFGGISTKIGANTSASRLAYHGDIIEVTTLEEIEKTIYGDYYY